MEKFVILITGASSGFGRATAERLAKKGHSLILAARRIDRLQEIAKKLPGKHHIAMLDVTDDKSVRKMFDSLPADFQDIDVLINNAGVALGTDPAQDTDLSDWQQMIAVNVEGLVNCTHYALQRMKKRNKGYIINVGSVAAIAPYPGGNVYGATKAFVKQFSRNLRADLFGTDIRVTNVEPGASETEFSIVRFKGDKNKAKAVYENARTLEAEDIADLLDYLISLPLRVNIDNIEIMPIDQTYAGLKMYRGE
jgi:3-hydroxy acid dehydrogenase / malonic semialdehyde reductase